jgi:RimJ/RimL family protein N-acetyltransferase
MSSTHENEFGQPIGPSMAEWTPRELPAPIVMKGKYCNLEPFDLDRHVHDLWEAFSVSDASQWTYLFAEHSDSEEALYKTYADVVNMPNYILYAIISGATGKAVGTMAFMNINLKNGDIEIGSINLSAQLKKSCSSTEAIYMMISRALDDYGYRRMTWKCNSLNAASRSAANRYGFTFEGLFRNHMVLKGRSRDTAWFSITQEEWPARKVAYETWLDTSNFDPQTGQQKQRLSELMPLATPLF